MKFIYLAALFIVLGCNRNAEVDIGELKDNQYENTFFGMTIPLPPDWSAQDDETRKKVMMQGASLIAGDDKNLAALLKTGQLNTINMFHFTRYPLGTPSDFNQNVSCLAENIKLYSGGVKNGKDYFFHLKKMLNQGKLSLKIGDNDSAASIGGRSFDILDVDIDIGNRTVGQRYFCSIMKDYAVVFIISFGNPDQKAELLKVLETVRFKDI